jgi:hypothetical protein
MAQRGAGRNGSVEPDGVFDDLNGTCLIDQRYIKAGIGQTATGGQSQKLLCRAIDTLLLAGSHTAGGAFEAVALLDLDKDQCASVAQDQVNLAPFAAPAVTDKHSLALFVMFQNDMLSSKARMIDDRPTAVSCC